MYAFFMRQQCMAAIHAKMLRLNGASIARVGTGHVVNLISSDVRRFDDAAMAWFWLLFAPLELFIVLLMVSLEIGVVPGLAGLSLLLLLMPMQVSPAPPEMKGPPATLPQPLVTSQPPGSGTYLIIRSAPQHAPARSCQP
jgi:hypothetical protein